MHNKKIGNLRSIKLMELPYINYKINVATWKMFITWLMKNQNVNLHLKYYYLIKKNMPYFLDFLKLSLLRHWFNNHYM